VAILVAIGVVAVLLTAGLALNSRIRSSVTNALLAREQVVLSEMALSGVHAAMVMLINDRKENDTDTIQEDWANPEKVVEMMGLIPYDDGRVRPSAATWPPSSRPAPVWGAWPRTWDPFTSPNTPAMPSRHSTTRRIPIAWWEIRAM